MRGDKRPDNRDAEGAKDSGAVSVHFRLNTGGDLNMGASHEIPRFAELSTFRGAVTNGSIHEQILPHCLKPRLHGCFACLLKLPLPSVSSSPPFFCAAGFLPGDPFHVVLRGSHYLYAWGYIQR
eukprot:1319277-Pleurochrysis_carterae.AAC.1